jgi:hypothetical protein
MAIERPQIGGADYPAARTVERQPGQAGRDRGADRWIEPLGSPAGLARVPDGDDLMRLSRRFALGLGALGFLRSGGSSLAFLCSTVGAHTHGGYPDFRSAAKELSP